MTPLGKGLIRYIATGSETHREASKYPSPLFIPSQVYKTGETVEVYLDSGYTVLDMTPNNKLESHSIPFGYSHQNALSISTKYSVSLEYVTDVRGANETSSLQAFETLQDRALSGTVLFTR